MGTAVPVPLKATVWGLPAALSEKASEAVRAPAVEGVNVTATVHVPLGASVAPVHESALLAKSLAFVPLIATLKKVRLTVPVLVTVSVFAALVVVSG